MRTAESFNALGYGNGFMSCLTKVNVSTKDFWTTLSGVNKDSPATSDALIEESRRLAMLFYWNSYQLNITTYSYYDDGISVEIYDPFPPPTPVAINTVEYKWDRSAGENVAGEFTPKSRVCDIDDYIVLYDFYEGPIDRRERVWFSPYNVIRMYNGATTNEDNFVGFGLGDRAIVAYFNHTYGTFVGYFWHDIRLVGYSNRPADSGSRRTGYTTLPMGTDEIHVVCELYAEYGVGDGNFSLTDRKITEAWYDLYIGEEDEIIITSIDSLDLYTY